MVLEQLSDEEAVRVAINLEEEGFKFYTELADTIDKQELQHTLYRLAEDEKKHKETFWNLGQSLSRSGGDHSWTKDETVIGYLRELVKPGVFGGVQDVEDVKALAKSLTNKRDALQVAIQAEKESISFYSEAAGLSVNKMSRRVFMQLIEEEKKHLFTLSQKLREVSAEG